MKLTIAPVTPDRWSELEVVFGAKGCSVARGCWCMAYRLSGSREPFRPGTTRSEANRAGLKALVDSGNSPGLIGYRGKVPVGWVSIGPREQNARLIEAYPVDKPSRSSDENMWFGAKSMFDDVGFKEVARRKPQRPIVRIRTAG